jgi:hypothetical protein
MKPLARMHKFRLRRGRRKRPPLAYCGDDCPGHTTQPPGKSCLKRMGMTDG